MPASHPPMDPMGVQLEGVCDEAPGCCFGSDGRYTPVCRMKRQLARRARRGRWKFHGIKGPTEQAGDAML